MKSQVLSKRFWDLPILASLFGAISVSRVFTLPSIKALRGATTLAAVALLSMSCGQDTKPPCPPAEATFRLQLSADGRPLPEDTQLTVTYGGSEQESYVLGEESSDNHNQVVCCTTARITHGALEPVVCSSSINALQAQDATRLDASLQSSDPETETAIHCELWTNGAARVEVRASGYSTLERVLEAQVLEVKQDQARNYIGCAMLRTSDVNLSLQAQDAGAP